MSSWQYQPSAILSPSPLCSAYAIGALSRYGELWGG